MSKKRKPRDLPLDELIRQFVRYAIKLEKQSGGKIGWSMQFEPKRAATEVPK